MTSTTFPYTLNFSEKSSRIIGFQLNSTDIILVIDMGESSSSCTSGFKQKKIRQLIPFQEALEIVVHKNMIHISDSNFN